MNSTRWLAVAVALLAIAVAHQSWRISRLQNDHDRVKSITRDAIGLIATTFETIASNRLAEAEGPALHAPRSTPAP